MSIQQDKSTQAAEKHQNAGWLRNGHKLKVCAKPAVGQWGCIIFTDGKYQIGLHLLIARISLLNGLEISFVCKLLQSRFNPGRFLK